MTVSSIKNTICSYFKRNGSTILTYISAAGVIGTTIASSKATVKAKEVLENCSDEKLTGKEKFKKIFPIYMPTILIGASTIGCIFGINYLNKSEQAALISACELINNSYREYRDSVKDIYGDEADKIVTENIIKSKANKVNITDAGLFSSSVNINSDDEVVRWFYDTYSDRSFESTLADVITAEYNINRNFASNSYVALNEFYEFLGLERVDYGDVCGWDGYQMVEEGLEPWIEFVNREVEIDDGLKCITIEFPIEPDINFLKDLENSYPKE